jgi:endonuclease G
MTTKRNRLRIRRHFKTLLVLVLLYSAGCVSYYFLPWSIRIKVYKNIPALDRTLRKSGFRIVCGWDELGLWGRDRKTTFVPAVRNDRTYGGYPSQGLQLFDRVKVLENTGYTAGYSESRRAPLWVAYRIFDVPLLDAGKRPSGFRIDHRTQAKVSHRDYTHSGYDRGHMAPNYAISTRYGRYAQRETFLMSNIIPQKPNINRYLWKDLEMLAARRYGRYHHEIWVITGPVYEKPVRQLESGVAIPSAYYKILVDQSGDEVRVKAFLVQSDCPPYSRIKSQLVSVDQLEELTRLDFFPELSREAQEEVESHPAGRLWPWLGSSVRYYLNH